MQQCGCTVEFFKWQIECTCCLPSFRTAFLRILPLMLIPTASLGFRGSSAGKEFICNAGDTSSIPESGRSPGEGIGYPLQYSSASLVAQTVKNPPPVWETPVRSLGQEDPLEEGMATHSSVLTWRIPMDRGASWATVHRVTKSWTHPSTHTAASLSFEA